jgi:hypothetical protein
MTETTTAMVSFSCYGLLQVHMPVWGVFFLSACLLVFVRFRISKHFSPWRSASPTVFHLPLRVAITSPDYMSSAILHGDPRRRLYIMCPFGVAITSPDYMSFAILHGDPRRRLYFICPYGWRSPRLITCHSRFYMAIRVADCISCAPLGWRSPRLITCHSRFYTAIRVADCISFALLGGDHLA